MENIVINIETLVRSIDFNKSGLTEEEIEKLVQEKINACIEVLKS